MILLLLFLSYIVGIFFILVIKNQSTQKQIALGAAGIALLVSTDLFANYKPYYTNNYRFTELISFFESSSLFSYSFGLDGLSISFLFLSCLLIFLCILFIWDEVKFKDYSINLLLIGLLLALIFTIEDLLLFYVCFEAILIPMFLIIGVWGSRERKVRAVYMFFFYTLCGSLVTLAGILYIYYYKGSLHFEYLREVPFTFYEQVFLCAAFFFSFASKIPMYPLHIWLPEAHVEAPTVGSVLLAGILLKLGVYGFIRYNLFVFTIGTQFWHPLIYTLGAIGVLRASFSAIRQTDVKRIIAYSSIAHMNLVTIGIFCTSYIGLQGAIFQSMSHGFVSGGMFLLIGILYSRYHTRILHYYGGLVHFMPIFSSFFLIFTMANIALPGTSSFVGEFLLLLATFQLQVEAAVIVSLGVIIAGAYSLWLYNRVIFGNIKVNYTKIFADVTLKEFVIMFSLLIFVILFGISPNILLEKI